MDLANTAFRDDGAAHWYSSDGKPSHTVIGKNGRERATTLRDARKEGLLPSVTSILKYLANPALDSWKQRQVLMAALTLPRGEHETEEAYAARVIEDSKQQVEKAAKWGSTFHAIAESINKGQADFGVPEAFLPYADVYQEWFQKNIVRVVAAETILVDPEHGYAGMCDLIAEHIELGTILLDYKRQDVKREKPAFYSKWLYQLAAYRHAYKLDCPCVSMIVDCNKPELHTRVWSEEELQKGWVVFKALCKVWQAEKGYYPNG